MSDRAEIERVRATYGARAAQMADVWSPLRPDQVMIDASRRRVWGAELGRLGRSLGRVVEVGCGSGAVLRWAAGAGGTPTVGVDLLPEHLREARSLDRAGAYLVADGRRMPLQAGSFDTAICSTVFSSILDDRVASELADEIVGLLKADGVVLWFDFIRNNPANAHVRGVHARDVRRLFRGFGLHGERVVLAPPLARRLAGRSRMMLAAEFAWPLRTHLAAVLVRRAVLS